jgi:hypothetical protein
MNVNVLVVNVQASFPSFSSGGRGAEQTRREERVLASHPALQPVPAIIDMVAQDGTWSEHHGTEYGPAHHRPPTKPQGLLSYDRRGRDFSGPAEKGTCIDVIA